MGVGWVRFLFWKMDDNVLLCRAGTLFSVASSSTLGQAKRSSVRPPCSLTSVRVSNLPIGLQDTLNTHIPRHSGRHFISFSSPWPNGPVFTSACPIDHFIELSVIRFNARLRKLYLKLTLSAQRPKTSVDWHVLPLTLCTTVHYPIPSIGSSFFTFFFLTGPAASDHFLYINVTKSISCSLLPM